MIRIGHRGAAGHAPENTLAGIWKAISFRVDFVEVDLRETADGHLVLLHDETVERTTNQTGRIVDLTLERVQRLNAGNWQRIPTLEEALLTASGRVGMILELKVDGIGIEALGVVRRSGFRGPVIFASFLTDDLVRIRQAETKVPTMVLFGKDVGTDPVQQATALKATHVGLHFRTATPVLVKRCRQAGLQVFVYTVNESSDIEAMRAIGVDGMVSDYPDRL